MLLIAPVAVELVWEGERVREEGRESWSSRMWMVRKGRRVSIDWEGKEGLGRDRKIHE